MTSLDPDAERRRIIRSRNIVLGLLLAAFVVPAARNGSSDLKFMLALRAALAERLPAYMIPKKFRFLESFPMTANGKADRRQLADLL